MRAPRVVCTLLILLSISAMMLSFIAGCDGNGNGPVGGGGTAALAIAPPAGPVGTEHAAKLSAFQSDELVTVEFKHAESGKVVYRTETRVDEKGNGLVRFVSKPEYPLGLYYVIATGDKGSKAQSTLTITKE